MASAARPTGLAREHERRDGLGLLLSPQAPQRTQLAGPRSGGPPSRSSPATHAAVSVGEVDEPHSKHFSGQPASEEQPAKWGFLALSARLIDSMSTGNARSSQFTGTLNAFATDTGGAIFIGANRGRNQPGSTPSSFGAGSRTSCRSCNRLDSSKVVRKLTPVRFPPGWARLETKPSRTGSSVRSETIGIVVVAVFCMRRRVSTARNDHRHPALNEIGG
jgi:hypothetical protein